jgi:ferrochelatase
MAIGIRATNAAPENRRPPGVESKVRYGESTRARYGTAPTTPPAVLRGCAVTSNPPGRPDLPARAVDAAPYDALLLVSFGGPDGPADVLPFLENVTRGRAIPRERLVEVGEHYYALGGASPINAQNQALVAALSAELAENGPALPVYWGNRNWAPYLTDTFTRMADDGVRRVLAVLTSAYSSYSGCRQYREDLAAAAAALGARAPVVDRVRHYFNHPGFVEGMVASTLAALDDLPAEARPPARLVFVTHSVPTSMNDASGPHGGAYEAQHRDLARVVTARVVAETGAGHPFDLVYCSRSGPPAQPWLGPDVNDHLVALAAAGTAAVVLVPIGFVSDHMEVRFDLDTEALGTAARLGLACTRAATVGTDPRFVAGLRDLVLERAAAVRGEDPPRPALGGLGPSHDRCPVGCCRNERDPARPALCGAPV